VCFDSNRRLKFDSVMSIGFVNILKIIVKWCVNAHKHLPMNIAIVIGNVILWNNLRFFLIYIHIHLWPQSINLVWNCHFNYWCILMSSQWNLKTIICVDWIKELNSKHHAFGYLMVMNKPSHGYFNQSRGCIIL
jgi:hypothetical protein